MCCWPAARPGSCAPPGDYGAQGALATWQWYALWSLLFLNVSDGSALLSQAAAMAQEMAGGDALRGAAVVSLFSTANAIGRLLWTGLSDVIGCRGVFLSMFVLQMLALLLLSGTATLVRFGLLGMLVVMCYGGGFGALAVLAADLLGARHVGPIYGLLLTACGCGGVAGPLLIASVRQLTGAYESAFVVLAAGMLVGIAVVVRLHPPIPGGATTPA
jgi:OFA family oxalate/formate antiporter-like MFS transporter